ncbi:MAG: carboxymuconolactone decarboxylase family protein [Hyphomicrobiaceae bacterium]
MSNDLFEKGLEVRKTVVGKDYVERSLAQADDFMMAFQELVTQYCWGHVWTRDGLSRRDRSLLNLGMLTALGKMEELKLHVRGAINNGLTNDEIREALLQAAIYAGIPAGLSAFKAAHEVLKAEGRL